MNPNTLKLVKAGLLLCAVALSNMGCESYKEPLPPRERLHFPVGMTMHPGGQFLYVINSNFDTKYNPDLGGTVSVIDTDTLKVLPNNSPYLPSFGGQIRLNGDATKAYVTARKNNVIVAFDVAHGDDILDGSALYCQDASGNKRSDPTACLVNRVPDQKGGAVLPSDPFGLDVVTVERTIQNVSTKIDVLGISHLRTSQLSAMSFPDGQVSAASLIHAPLIDGANAVASRPGTMNMYAAGRNSNKVVIYAPYLNDRGQVEALINRGSIELNHVATSVDARGIAFNKAGDRLYVTTRRPDALHVFAIGPEDLETGTGTQHDLVRTIYLPDQPSDVVVFEPGSGDNLIYVPCYDDQSIQVINPVTGAIIDEVKFDSRPYDMAIDVTDRYCDAGQRCRAYVTLFSDSANSNDRCEESARGCGSVAVIELNRQDPRYHQIIAKIR